MVVLFGLLAGGVVVVFGFAISLGGLGILYIRARGALWEWAPVGDG